MYNFVIDFILLSDKFIVLLLFYISFRRRSLTFGTRRASLQGVDNDPSFNYDPIVLLRKNSAINLGKVYEQVQRHLQSSSVDPQDSQGQDPATVRGSRTSSKLSPLRRGSSYGVGANSGGGGGYGNVRPCFVSP